jgi:hypothetical protein
VSSPDPACVSAGRAARRRPWPPWPDVIAALAYFGLSVIPYWNFWMAGGTRIAGKGGDVADEAWFLGWVPYALMHAHNPLVTNWGNFPSGVNGAANTSVPLLGLLGTPVTLAFGAFATAALLFTIAFPLSALSAYLLFRHWVRWRPAAFAGGLLYGFSPYLVAQGLGHLNLMFVPLPPLIFLVLCRIAELGPGPGPGPGLGPRRPWVWGAVLALLCVAQFFISIEVLASTAIVGATGLLAAAACWPAAVRDRWRPLARAIGVGVGVSALLLAYPLWLLVAGPERIAGPVQETSLYRGNLLAPVIPDSSMYFRVARFVPLADTFSGNTSENGLYLGIPLLLILIAGAITLRRRPVMKIAVMAVIVAFVLALGSRLTVGRYVWTAVPLPGAVLARIPLLDNTIAVRYSLYVMLGAALTLALTLEVLRGRGASPEVLRGRGASPEVLRGRGASPEVLRRYPHLLSGGRRPTLAHQPALAAVACGALACLTLVPLVPAWPYTARVTQVPRYFSSAAVTAIPGGSVAVTYPFPTSADATPMLWQIAASMRFKSPGGRFILPASAPTPVERAFTELASGGRLAMTQGLRCVLRTELRSWHVRAVLVQRSGQHPALVMPFFEWLLGRPPDTRSGGISAWYGLVAGC